MINIIWFSTVMKRCNARRHQSVQVRLGDLFNQKLLGSIESRNLRSVRIFIIIVVDIFILIFLTRADACTSFKAKKHNAAVDQLCPNLNGSRFFWPILSSPSEHFCPRAPVFAASWQGEPHPSQQLQRLHARAFLKGSRNCSAPPSIACLVEICWSVTHGYTNILRCNAHYHILSMDLEAFPLWFS